LQAQWRAVIARNRKGIAKMNIEENRFHANRCQKIAIWRERGNGSQFDIAHCHENPSRGFPQKLFDRQRDAIVHALKTYRGIPIYKETATDWVQIA
jgi:hypothetical protein